MEKKEIKKYFLVEKICVEKRTYENYNDYEELAKAINKYNSNNKNKFLCSKANIAFDEKTGNFVVQFIKYRKITEKAQTLKGIDLLTTSYETSRQFRESICSHLQDIRNQVCIVYKKNKDLQTKTMLFAKDKKYLDVNYIIDSLLHHASDIQTYNQIFFVKMCYDKKFCSNPKSVPYLDNIESAASKAYLYSSPCDALRKPINAFVTFFTTNNDGTENYLNLRNLALYCKDKTPKEKVDENVYEQLKFELENNNKKLTLSPKNDK